MGVEAALTISAGAAAAARASATAATGGAGRGASAAAGRHLGCPALVVVGEEEQGRVPRGGGPVHRRAVGASYLRRRRSSPPATLPCQPRRALYPPGAHSPTAAGMALRAGRFPPRPSTRWCPRPAHPIQEGAFSMPPRLSTAPSRVTKKSVTFMQRFFAAARSPPLKPTNQTQNIIITSCSSSRKRWQGTSPRQRAR